MAHLLIGFAEALPAPEVVFSLRAAGHRISAFARRGDLVLRHLELDSLHVIPAPEKSISDAAEALRSLFLKPSAPDLVMPLDDSGLWLVNHALADTGRIAGATGHQAKVALDKSLQIEAASAAGLPVPPTQVVRTPTELASLTDFPVIVKPAMAVSSHQGRLGKGDASYLTDLVAAQALQHSLTEDMDPLLVQPLIAGRGEGVFGFAGSKGVVAWSGHIRLRMMNPHGSGSSACVSNPPDQDLRQGVSDFLNRIGWRGPFMVELLRDSKGTPWFMELNGRMWGSMALARRQGLEYPAWAASAAIDPEFVPDPPQLPPEPLILRHLGRDLVHLLFVLRGPKSAFHKKDWPSFARSAAGVLRPAPPRMFYNYDPDHRLYFLRDAVATIKGQLSR